MSPPRSSDPAEWWRSESTVYGMPFICVFAPGTVHCYYLLRHSPGLNHFCSLRPIHTKVRFPVG